MIVKICLDDGTVIDQYEEISELDMTTASVFWANFSQWLRQGVTFGTLLQNRIKYTGQSSAPSLRDGPPDKRETGGGAANAAPALTDYRDECICGMQCACRQFCKTGVPCPCRTRRRPSYAPTKPIVNATIPAPELGCVTLHSLDGRAISRTFVNAILPDHLQFRVQIWVESK